MRPLCRFVVTLASLLALPLLLTGCAGSGAVTLNVHFISSASLNPNIKGEPSPVLVRYYELTSPANFENASYFAAIDPASSDFQQDLLVMDEISLAPAEEKNLSRKLNPSTRYIGFVAAYRDINHATWRTVVEVTARIQADYSVRLSENTLTVTLPDDVNGKGADKFNF